MSRPIFPNSVAYRPDGEPWAYAPFALELLTTPAVRASAAYPTRPIYKFSTDANGAFATDLTINTPETGAWLWRLWWPDRRYIDAYIEQGDGSAIEMDDWVTLAGQAGSAAGTPQGEFLNGLYTAVSGADDGFILETEGGNLTLVGNRSLSFVSVATNTNHTVASADNKAVIECITEPDAHVTVTLPATETDGMSARIANMGTGVVRFAIGSGGVLRSHGTRLVYPYSSADVYYHGGEWIATNLLTGTEQWIGRGTPADNSWESLAWSPELGLFAAVANSGVGNRVMTSPDGINWTIRVSAADNQWNAVAWSPELGLFAAVATSGVGNRVMTSPDGINWTIRVSAADNSWYGLAWSAELGLFAAVSGTGTGNRVMTSPDGINWTIQVSAADNQWNAVAWSPELSLFVAVAVTGTGNRVMTSPDGINWTIRASAADNQWYGLAWSAELGLFAAVAGSGTGNRVMTSPDGINWTSHTASAENNWRDVVWSPELGLFAAVAGSGTGNRVMTSPDGINWTSRAASTDMTWEGLAWSPELGLFVAVAIAGTGIRAMTSKS